MLSGTKLHPPNQTDDDGELVVERELVKGSIHGSGIGFCLWYGKRGIREIARAVIGGSYAGTLTGIEYTVTICGKVIAEPFREASTFFL
jgi:hypothetical protein